MNTTLMTRHERIAQVQKLGYAEPEAEFLSLVALHGDYFVRRQFDAWIGVERSKRSEDFLADLLDRGHCRRQVFAHNRQVFHLRFRPLYRAVGDEYSRNRRDHQPQAVKARLMALDYVVAHPENRYFATEREKIAHLCDERRIEHEAPPAKLFRGRDGSALTRRCLLDRLPIFTRPGAYELAFCYVDSGFETYAAFATYLNHYLPLFAELPSFELVYVTTASSRLGQAQTVFERVLSRGRKRPTNLADPDRLIAHFGDRQLFEKRETSNFDRDRLDRLRVDMDTFSGPHFAEMFARWRPPATKIFAPKLPPRRCRTIAACTEKATDLDALERLHNDVDRAPWRERSKKGPFTSVSMEAFTKDSLGTRSTRAIRPLPWRMDPCFGVRGGAGATPVSVGCAATNPTVLALAPSWVTPAPPLRVPRVFCYANCMANRPLTRWRFRMSSYIPHNRNASVIRSRLSSTWTCCVGLSNTAASWSQAATISSVSPWSWSSARAKTFAARLETERLAGDAERRRRIDRTSGHKPGNGASTRIAGDRELR